MMFKKPRWESKLWTIIEKSEKVLVKIMILAIICLVAAQSILSTNSMSFYLSWAERLEGQPFQEWSNSSARVMESESGLFAHMTIELKDYSSLAKAKLLINGQETADFRNKRVTVKIYPEDIISVDGSFYRRPLKFEIVEISSNIKEPSLHQNIETNDNVASFVQVKFK